MVDQAHMNSDCFSYEINPSLTKKLMFFFSCWFVAVRSNVLTQSTEMVWFVQVFYESLQEYLLVTKYPLFL